MTATVYSFLVRNGLWTGVIYSATGVLVTATFARAWAALHGFHPLKSWQEHVRAQKRIAEALDTTVPGGLTDVVKALNKEK